MLICYSDHNNRISQRLTLRIHCNALLNHPKINKNAKNVCSFFFKIRVLRTVIISFTLIHFLIICKILSSVSRYFPILTKISRISHRLTLTSHHKGSLIFSEINKNVKLYVHSCFWILAVDIELFKCVFNLFTSHLFTPKYIKIL